MGYIPKSRHCYGYLTKWYSSNTKSKFHYGECVKRDFHKYCNQ